MRFVRHLVSWGLSLFLIAMFLQGTVHPLPDPPLGQVKLFDLPGENIVFQTLADRSGYPLFEPFGRVFTALVELLAALFLVFPLTRRFGAMISFLIVAVALVLHLSPWLGRDIPTSLDPTSGATDGGLLFTLAISMAVTSILVIVVHPTRNRY